MSLDYHTFLRLSGNKLELDESKIERVIATLNKITLAKPDIQRLVDSSRNHNLHLLRHYKTLINNHFLKWREYIRNGMFQGVVAYLNSLSGNPRKQVEYLQKSVSKHLKEYAALSNNLDRLRQVRTEDLDYMTAGYREQITRFAAKRIPEVEELLSELKKTIMTALTIPCVKSFLKSTTNESLLEGIEMIPELKKEFPRTPSKKTQKKASVVQTSYHDEHFEKFVVITSFYSDHCVDPEFVGSIDDNFANIFASFSKNFKRTKEEVAEFKARQEKFDEKENPTLMDRIVDGLDDMLMSQIETNVVNENGAITEINGAIVKLRKFQADVVKLEHSWLLDLQAQRKIEEVKGLEVPRMIPGHILENGVSNDTRDLSDKVVKMAAELVNLTRSKEPPKFQSGALEPKPAVQAAKCPLAQMIWNSKLKAPETMEEAEEEYLVAQMNHMLHSTLLPMVYAPWPTFSFGPEDHQDSLGIDTQPPQAPVRRAPNVAFKAIEFRQFCEDVKSSRRAYDRRGQVKEVTRL